jgi:putative Ca2+/H+ antiporter (TMEM165/GDT1 family)
MSDRVMQFRVGVMVLATAIIAGILVATLVNHAAAGAVGGWVAQALGPDVLRWVIGLGFLAMAGWMLIPDKMDDDALGTERRFGVFGTTVVAFFLAGLVVLGGQQQWWLKPALLSMTADQVYYGATALTAITDNAALTYLGSLVEGLSDEFKVALVAGAVTGGGLTIIANAPNPAGFAILKDHLEDNALNPLGLLLAALPPTLVTIAAFRFL